MSKENNGQGKVLIADLEKKMKIDGRVIRTSIGGALIDINAELPAMLHISQIQKEAINRVDEVIKPGDEVKAWVKRIDKRTNRVELTMIEPLEYEWRELKKGLVVKGKVTKIEPYGVFVDFGGERPGLVHISEITHGYIKNPSDIINEGEEVEVQILSVNRKKQEIKLSIKALEKELEELVADEEDSEPTLTAMEFAMKHAKEKADKVNVVDEDRPSKKEGKNKKSGEGMDDILSRTLTNRKD